MSRILIKNPLRVATMNDKGDEWTGGHIVIENDKITSLGPEEISGNFDKVIDATGMVVLPGFINTHHHLYQSLTRNIPLMQDLPLFGWLTNHYEVWRELTEEAVTISTKTGLLELMLSGTTTSSDHLYLFPRKAGTELIDREIESALEMGIRFQPTRGSMSLGKSEGGLPPDDVVQTEAEIIADTDRLLAKYHNDQAGAMTRISLAPCSPFSVTGASMRKTADFARANNLMIHTHLAETIDEENFCIEQFGHRPAAYLDSLGWIAGNAWVAHAVHLSDAEIAQMGACGMGIAHCPSSNMRLGSGIARIKEMLKAGVAASLAVDGSASNDSGNMLAEIRQAMLISRLREEDYWLTAREVIWMATRVGAAALGRSDVGELAVGKQADLALFDINSVEYAGGHSDPVAALVFNVRMSPVDHLIVNGEVRVENKKFQGVIGNLFEVHNKISDEMISRAAKNTGINFLNK